MADATPQSLDSLFYKTADAFFAEHNHTALTYDDVTLATLYSEVLPRDAQLDTRLADSLHLRIPIVSADMDTVTEAEMAIARAEVDAAKARRSAAGKAQGGTAGKARGGAAC